MGGPVARAAARSRTDISFPDARALSLGAVRYVVQDGGDEFTTNGVTFNLTTSVSLPPAAELTLPVDPTAPLTSIQAVTSLSDAMPIADGTPALAIDLMTTDGQVISTVLRAGIETAMEPDVGNDSVLSAHPTSAVIDGATGKIYGYLSRSPIGLPSRATSVRLRSLLESGTVHIRAINLVDDRFLLSQSVTLNPEYTVVVPGNPTVFENRSPRSRVALVSSYTVVGEEEALVTARDLPPSIVAVTPAAVPFVRNVITNSSVVLDQPRIDLVTGERMVVRTNARYPALLVVADLDYPGWKATIDGSPAPVLRANGLVRAVPVPEGAHSVTLTFAPDSFFTGLRRTLVSLAIAALVALLALPAAWRRRRRQVRSVTGETERMPDLEAGSEAAR
jgi:hypothetical protein